MESALAAALQMSTLTDVERNLGRAAALCEVARGRGARLAVLPENFALMSSDEDDKFRHAVDLSQPAGQRGQIIEAMQALAARLQLDLILGGLPERAPSVDGQPRVYNACVHLRADGQGGASIAAVYRKIHLFDVDFTAAATTLRESATVAAGDPTQAIVTDSVLGPLGLSVCYDLRFPELYRRLGERGARTLVVPAAFTLHTGRDHWHLLLRARAVENQCFVIAAAQHGRHPGGRQTYGHSLIVDPWGTVLADCPDGEGVAIAPLDFAAQQRIRRELPCLDHRRIDRQPGARSEG